jgi:hypothetical protein
MHDNYASVWSILFWIAAGVISLIGLLALLAPTQPLMIPASQAKREGSADTFMGIFFLAGLLVMLGFIAQGSRSADALRLAQHNVNVAQVQFEQADHAYREKVATSDEISSSSRSMSFDNCIKVLDETGRRLDAEPIDVLSTNDVRIAQFGTNDSSVLITCSRPDSKMITMRGDRR